MDCTAKRTCFYNQMLRTAFNYGYISHEEITSKSCDVRVRCFESCLLHALFLQCLELHHPHRGLWKPMWTGLSWFLYVWNTMDCMYLPKSHRCYLSTSCSKVHILTKYCGRYPKCEWCHNGGYRVNWPNLTFVLTEVEDVQSTLILR